jgi:hypothetical protein
MKRVWGRGSGPFKQVVFQKIFCLQLDFSDESHLLIPAEDPTTLQASFFYLDPYLLTSKTDIFVKGWSYYS